MYLYVHLQSVHVLPYSSSIDVRKHYYWFLNYSNLTNILFFVSVNKRNSIYQYEDPGLRHIGLQTPLVTVSRLRCDDRAKSLSPNLCGRALSRTTIGERWLEFTKHRWNHPDVVFFISLYGRLLKLYPN